MKLQYIPLITLFILGCKTMKTTEVPAPDNLSQLDYLENVEGPEALQFARKNNEYSNSRLKTDKRYTPTFDAIFKIVSAKDKLPVFYQLGSDLYNFWQDDVHIKGILRKANLK